MINLNFTEKELEILKEYFQSELYKAEQKIDNIRGILGKIGKKYGKITLSEKKSQKRGRKKEVVLASLLPKQDFEPKKRGRKPKAVKEVDINVAAKIQKKRGRPPKIQSESLAPANKIRKQKSSVESVKAATVKKSLTGNTKSSASVGMEKRKPGRPRKNPVTVVVEKKAKSLKGEKKTPKRAVNRQVKPKADAEKTRKREVRTPKIPWGDWILAVLRESDNNLNQDQIFTAVSKKLKLSAEEFQMVESKLKDHMFKLIKSNRIIPDSDKANPLFSLRITGKGIR